MTRTRRVEVNIETDELVVIRRPERLIQAGCRECGEQVRMVSPTEAAALKHVSWRTISRWIEEGRVHFVEMADGLLLICTNSLSYQDDNSGVI